MEVFAKNIPILVVNGATLLIVVIILIRVFAKLLERLVNGITQTITTLKDEIVALRSDIRDAANQTAIAVGALTERVSRIEGKIEGIALSRAPEMSDQHETTGVHHNYPPSEFDPDEQTPVEIPHVKPRRTTTPATGNPRLPTSPGAYATHKPKSRS